MHTRLPLFLFLLAGCGRTPEVRPEAARAFTYPTARRADQVDDYHGVKVADPYRWLEDPDSPETRAWVEAENRLTLSYLEKLPTRDHIRKRLTELWNFERYGVPVKRGARYFFEKNDGLQNQSVLYSAPSLDGAPQVVIDPNTLSSDGTVALASTVISDDGKYVAYGLSKAGSDWVELRVREVESGRDLTDHLQWIKFSAPSWRRDGRGFFYSRYPEPQAGAALEEQNFFNKLYYHELGKSQADDTLIYERPDHKEWGFDPTVTEDDKVLIISVSKGTDDKNMVLYRRLEEASSQVTTLIDNFAAEYSFLNNDGSLFWFKTTADAPRGRIIAIDSQRPEPGRWRELIPESDATIDDANVVGDRFLLAYLRDAHSEVKVFALSGKYERDLNLPGLGTVGGLSGKRKDSETFYSFAGFARPSTIYRYDIPRHTPTLWREPVLKFEPNDFETKQVFVTSKDGTRVPLFVSQRKDIPKSPRTPTLLYGYGGFNISITPWFSPAYLLWMEMGGIFAVANLRGGGEYGEEWHHAGTHENKQNVFDDFAAAAEWLPQNGYTSADRLAITGRSNGGLLVGASITQHPELFGAALPAVGVHDMLRFHKFTIGWAWVDDYGSSDQADGFKALYAYSPLHNVRPGAHYPATLLSTADHDDRVVPAHSYKFAATLQAAQAGDQPVLIRIETSAGHGRGTPTAKLIEEVTDQFAFVGRALKLTLGPGPQAKAAGATPVEGGKPSGVTKP